MEHSYIAGRNVKCAATVEKFEFLNKLNIVLSHDSAIPPLAVYPKELKIRAPANICTHLFIAAAFTIAKGWKQPRCPSADEWINKIGYIHTTEYYSATKRNELLIYATLWIMYIMLKNIMLNERRT